MSWNGRFGESKHQHNVTERDEKGAIASALATGELVTSPLLINTALAGIGMLPHHSVDAYG
jgi:hypothetical protein